MPRAAGGVAGAPGPWLAGAGSANLPAIDFNHLRHALETHGPLGTLWVGLGLMHFYVALIWINSLLGLFLTPLFIIPLTWLQDRVMARRRARPQTR